MCTSFFETSLLTFTREVRAVMIPRSTHLCRSHQRPPERALDHSNRDPLNVFMTLLMTLITASMMTLSLSGPTSAQVPFNSQDLSTGYNAYYMAVLSALAYEDEDLIGESYRKLGLSRCSGLKKFKVIDEVHDNTSGHLSTDGHRIFLLMRGTDDVEDIIKNLKLLSTTRPKWGEVPIHKGFSELAESFINATHLYDKLKACGADREIYVGGHSLGGALANIIAIELKLKHLNIKGIYTFGSPRVGGEAWISYFNKTFPQQHFQWRNIHDPVPYVPKGALMYKSFKHLLLGRNDALKITIENLNPFDGKGSFSYHNKKKYAFDLWEKFSLSSQVDAKLAPLSLMNAGKLSVYCSSDRHCQKDQYCATVGRNHCEAKKALDRFCLRSANCLSGHCIMGQCSVDKASESQEMKVIESP